MLRFLIACLVTSLAGSAPALSGWIHGSASPASAGQLFLSLGDSDLPGAFINWSHSCQSQSFNTGSSPASLDANGYPNVSPPGATIFSQCSLPTLTQYSGTWEIGWTGTGEITIQGTTITVTSDPQSCNKGSGKLAGSNCDVVFNFAVDPTITLQFNSGNTFSGMGGLFLIRSSDKTAYLAGQIWSPEFLSINAAMNPPLVRTMGMSFPSQTGTNENEVSWNYRTPLTAMSWRNAVWFPNLWSSSVTGTDQYTAAGATDTPVTWTDRELLQGTMPNANSAPLNITGAANNGSGLVRLLVSSTTGLTTNQQVLIANINGLNAPPYVWTITVIDSTHIDLQGSTFSASWNPNATSCSGGGACLYTTTINIASRGAKFIMPSGVLGNLSISANQNFTLLYDATIAFLGSSPSTPVGAMFYKPGGVSSGVPIEAQVNLANALGVSLWTNLPPFYQSASATSFATYVCGAASKTPYFEYNNENWNFIFQMQWHIQHGLGLGLTNNTQFAGYSNAGLIYRQLMGAVSAACPQAKRINAAQAFGSPTNFDTYQFKGNVLCGSSCGNSVYQALVGTDYNTAPNRPLDYSDYLSIASYFGGGAQTNGNTGTLTQLTGACDGTQCTGVIAASACFAAPSNATCGTGGTAQLALNFVDSDTRNGTFVGGGGGTFSIAQTQTGSWAPWNTLSVSDNRPLIAYEGGYAGSSQSAAYLSSIGDGNSSADATNINNMLIAYRSSSLFNATYQFWHQTWMANSKVVANANLQLEGAGSISVNSQYWGMMPGTYLNGVFYQNYPAACSVNGRSC